MTFDELIETYPFLYIDEETNEHEFTWLDQLDYGWKKYFGFDLCRDLKEALIKDGCLDSFQIHDIKEKYGQLDLIASNYGENTSKVIEKYGNLSRYICGYCGRPAKYITSGWNYPLCKQCAAECDLLKTSIPIVEYYDFNNYKEIEQDIERIKNS